jgi:hypothetical protein
MCWLDPTTVAIGGIGDESDEMTDGARIFDVTQLEPSRSDKWIGNYARELGAFPGPGGRFFGDGERLFAAGEAGLSCWHVATGERRDFVEGFGPTRHHRGARELAELTDRGLIRFVTDRA